MICGKSGLQEDQLYSRPYDSTISMFLCLSLEDQFEIVLLKSISKISNTCPGD